MKKVILKILYNFLAFCSRIYLWKTKPVIIGITGSVGKTTCRMIVAEVLQGVQTSNKKLKIYSSPKNYNSELGLVFSIFCIEEYSPGVKSLLKLALGIFRQTLFAGKKYDVLIAEYGIDAPGDMDFLLKIATPDISVITKLGSVHSENFPGGISELWQQKFLLLLAAKSKVYFNVGDSFCQEHKDLLSRPYTEIFAKNISSELLLSENNLIQSWEYNKKQVSLNILGKEEQEYVNLGFQLADDLGVKIDQEKYDFRIELLPGRFGVFQYEGNIFIDSTYNASPEAMIKLIQNTQELQKNMFPDHTIGYILGDMREIGEVNESAHKNLVKYVGDAKIIATVGPQLYQHFVPQLKNTGYSGDIHASLSAREVGKYLQQYLEKSSEQKYILLFKGSQNTIFLEEALAALLTPSERKNLVRQGEDWKRKKDNFFKSL